jgi:hypothetical protein
MVAARHDVIRHSEASPNALLSRRTARALAHAVEKD